jgi:membrane-bound serine protease (ClpP class)
MENVRAYTIRRLLVILCALCALWASIALAAEPTGTINSVSPAIPPATTPGVVREAPRVLAISVDGPISPVTSEYVLRNIERANDEGYAMLVVEMDTPGGLMDSMRSIIKAMVNSDVPVAVYVGPPGARAASAGAFITIAAHVAAMAPQTNIGAAHPVGAGGGEMDEVMAGKVTNDAVAYIKSLAARRGRNVEWAEAAVRNSVSATETEALDLGVVDMIANSTAEMVEAVHGRSVEMPLGPMVMNTAGARVDRVEMGTRLRILELFSNPSIAYLLMIIGFYGIFFEMTNPGALFPGIVGAICLILAFYAMQTLPVNYAGLLLILLAIILFFLETQIVSHGALAVGGIAALTIGSVMLFEDAGPEFQISLGLIGMTVAVTSAFFILLIRLAVKAQGRKTTTGHEGLVGMEGVALGEFGPGTRGQISLHGEIWSAESDEPVTKGQRVVVESAGGLTVRVRPEQDKTG